jgi:hypothetical protein
MTGMSRHSAERAAERLGAGYYAVKHPVKDGWTVVSIPDDDPERQATEPRGSAASIAIAKAGFANVVIKRAFNEWVEFRSGPLLAQVVVFDQPSRFGIEKGRVSKLRVRQDGGNCVLEYDRGWVVRPKTKEAKALLAKIHELFPERLPQEE